MQEKAKTACKKKGRQKQGAEVFARFDCQTGSEKENTGICQRQLQRKNWCKQLQIYIV